MNSRVFMFWMFLYKFFTSESLQVFANKSGAQPFGVFTLGDTQMKQVLCAADARAGIVASFVSALLCAATLSGPAMADPAAAATGSATTTPSSRGGGELEEIVVTAEKRES